MNWIDTVAVYGCGINREHRAQLAAASIHREAEASLSQLKLDTVDLCQIQWPVWKGCPKSAPPGSIEEAAGELPKLKDEGKIRDFDAQRTEGAINVAPITSLQLQYWLLATDVESSILRFALRHRIE